MRRARFAIIVLILAAAFHFIPIFDGLEAGLINGVSGLAKGLRGAAMAIAAFPGHFRQMGLLMEENNRLKDQILGLEERLSALAGAQEENASLRALINFENRSEVTTIPANVIGLDPDSSLHAVVIDRGTKSGVRLGDAVIAEDGIFVGKIIRADAGRSTVLLTYDPRSRIAAMIQGHPEANGVSSGERGLVMTLSYIPQQAVITEGDVVVTSGEETAVPRGLVLGTVDSINREPSQPFISATIIPAIDVLRLTIVAVVQSAGS